MGLLSGRLGLEKAGIPHRSRHGLLWLERGALSVEDGCLMFSTAGFGGIGPGEYGIPHQTVSSIIIGPGTSITHDAVRILASHGTSILFTGVNGVRMYSSPPLMPDTSALARRQVKAWADPASKVFVARKMFAVRFGEVFPHKNLDVLRGIEGSRLKKVYVEEASRHGITWNGRHFDRGDPSADDLPNQCINHVATAMYSAAAVAVYSVGAIPQLGFIHEDSGEAFCLDVADLFRASIIIPKAFSFASYLKERPYENPERYCRIEIGKMISANGVIDAMIDHIKAFLDGNDDHRDQ